MPSLENTLARAIRQEFPATAVVVLSAHVEVEHAMDLVANGHRTGYLLKSRVTDITEFVETLKRVERGGSGTVEKHVRSIMIKLRLLETPDVHRRVLAVLAFLDAH